MTDAGSGRIPKPPERTTVRIAAARSLLRLAFHVIRPKRLYEPVELGGRRFPEKRESELRWAAIAKMVQDYDAKNLLDIGCAEGWFLRRAAKEFGCFGIGVEAGHRRVLLGEIARLHDAAERVAVIKARLTPTDIEFPGLRSRSLPFGYPSCDARERCRRSHGVRSGNWSKSAQGGALRDGHVRRNEARLDERAPRNARGAGDLHPKHAAGGRTDECSRGGHYPGPEAGRVTTALRGRALLGAGCSTIFPQAAARLPAA